MRKISLLCATAALVTPAAIYAQQITSEIEGRVTDAAGAPVGNATVTITDTRTGAVRSLVTAGDGLFSARGLTVGGPYTITATAEGLQGQTIQDITTTLQGATSLTFTLEAADTAAAAETIVVTGTRVRVAQLATGPGTSFGTDVLEAAPTFNRDIRDVIRLDPRVSLDRDDGDTDRISCLGGNDRGNAFTVDGITQSDVYGLNDTGFSARSSTPLPYDAIRETQVQFAPFDVEYGQFTGCAINVVTRGGTNRFRGSAFYEYTADELQGDKLDGQQLDIASFTDKRYGVSIGGPIIKDRLFFFGAYEKQKSSDPLDEGPLGGGFSTELTAITQETFNQVSDIIRNTYGIDTGPIPKTQPFTNERFFGRLDFQITEGQRLEATYQRLEEAEVRTDDYFTNQNSPQVAGLNTFLTQGSVSDYYSARLFSTWTDRVSTELRYSRSEITDRQNPIGGGEAQSDNPIPRIIVGVQNGGRQGTILAGPGISRSANDLQSTIEQYKASMNVDFGDHQLKLGAELNRADIFNLFVSNATGTLVFRSIADLQAGLLSPGTGDNQTGTFPNQVINGQTEGAFGNFTASGDVTDAAARVKRNAYSFYVQDDWRVNDNLNVVLGLRTDFFDGNHPQLNPNFLRRYGFQNTSSFSNLEPVLLPRFAATYDVDDFSIFSRTQVRAGVGIFSGGDPLVFFGNAFQNDGSTFSLATTQASGCPAGQIDVVVNGQFTGVPQCVVNAAAQTAALGQGNTQAIDPDLKVTTVLRANLGLETRLNFGGGVLEGWRLNLDYIYSRFRNPLSIVDLAQAVDTRLGLNGFTVDGRPIYRQIDLTRAGCTGRLVDPGAPPVFTGINAACFSSARVDELLLTNQRGYSSQIASIILSKDFDRGVFTPEGNVFFTLGYAYTDAKDRRNLFNSTAGSNYDNVAAFDRQNPRASTGFYNTRHNFTLNTTFREKFFGDNDTTFGFSFVARSGRPYSLTFTGGGVFNASASGSDNTLLYIPTGISDPNLSPLSNPTAVQQLVDFLGTIDCDNGFAGRTIRRNTCSNNWFYDLDLRFSQEFPGPGNLFGVEDKVELYAMVDNFLNLLDSSWNTFRRRQTQGFQDVAQLDTTSGRTGVDAQGRYIIRTFTGDTFAEDNVLRTSASLWRLKVGISYKF
jgi:outer membrane receptor for ferrienterochelin and colicin